MDYNITFNNTGINWTNGAAVTTTETVRLVPLTDLIFIVLTMVAMIAFLMYSKNKPEWRGYKTPKGRTLDVYKYVRFVFYMYVALMVAGVLLIYFLTGQEFLAQGQECIGAGCNIG